MPSISMHDAILRITQQIQDLERDDIVEVYNEIFPEAPASIDDKLADSQLKAAIMAHVTNGLMEEEVVDLWNVLFPSDKNVWYDEVAGAIQVNEEPQWVESES